MGIPPGCPFHFFPLGCLSGGRVLLMLAAGLLLAEGSAGSKSLTVPPAGGEGPNNESDWRALVLRQSSEITAY